MRPGLGDQRSHWQDSFALIVEKKREKRGWGGEGREGVMPMLAQLTLTN